MYTEYTLGAADLAHISADVMRYRNTIIRALEAGSRKDFERITESLLVSGLGCNSLSIAMRPQASCFSQREERAGRHRSRRKSLDQYFLRPAPRSTCCPENGMPLLPANGIGYVAMQRNMPQTMPALR